MMIVASTPETTNPVATTCEAEGMPCLSTKAPWQPWFIGQQGDPTNPEGWQPFNYAFHYFWGLEDVIAVFLGMWNQLDTNKTWAGSSPTTRTATPGATPTSAWRRASRGGLPDHRPRPLPEPHGRLLAQINAFKAATPRSSPGV
jgi:branched-chain amino acid transport system substrate-binding protein